MTKAQEKMVNRIRNDAETMHNNGGYEIKQWEVKDNEWGTVSIYFEIGLIGDEGTMAEYIGRDSLQIFIGPKGGTKIPCYTRKKDGSFRNFYEKYTNIWSACYSYNHH